MTVKKETTQERKCRICGLDPTPLSYDACLGYIKKCKDACKQKVHTLIYSPYKEK